MSVGEIKVDADLIQQHATRVDQLAADAAEAVSAIRSINLSGGAFGMMCAWMVPPVAVVSSAVGSAISSGQDVITRTASEIRLAASDFATHEQAVIDGVRSFDAGFAS